MIVLSDSLCYKLEYTTVVITTIICTQGSDLVLIGKMTDD